MNHINIGDVVQNSRGWQGKVVDLTLHRRTGQIRLLVQYASRSEWENESGLTVAVRAAGGIDNGGDCGS